MQTEICSDTELLTLPDNEPESLVLDECHPGIQDLDYVKRRQMFFDASRFHRLNSLPAPVFEYSDLENSTWQKISKLLDASHQRHANAHFLAAKQKLSLESDEIPQLEQVSAILKNISGFRLAPAEGLIHFRSFFSSLADGALPCTQYIRHHSKPEFTPEPDIVHDVIGHVPMLVDPLVAEILVEIGNKAKSADGEMLLALNRLYWFTIEFGLIEEDGGIKVFGAGLLSSIGEMEFCMSSEVERREFDIREVIQTSYDPTAFQRKLFIISSLEELLEAIKGSDQNGVKISY